VSIISLVKTPVYKAGATIEIAPENPKITTFEEVINVDAMQREFYETQYQLIKSKSLAKEVVNSLALGSHREFATGEKSKQGLLPFIKNAFAGIITVKRGSDLGETEKKKLAGEEGLINSFIERVKVTPDRKSRLLDISFESADRELSANAVNTLVDKFIEWVLDRRLDATKAARGFLEKQLEQVKAKLERAEEELSAFAKSADIVSLDENLNLIYKQLAELNETLSETESERLSKEALYKEVQNGNYEYLPQVMSDPSIQALNEEYTKLNSEYDHLAVVYGPNYPEIKQLRARRDRIRSDIAGRTDAIAESIKKDYQGAVRKENIIRKRTTDQKNQTARLNDKAIQYKILEREVDTNKSIYQNLLQRLKETEVTSGIKATNIQVVDYASVPLVPYKPNIRFNVLLATLMGLMIGVFLTFIFEHFDNTIKDEEEFKRRFSLPVLGAVPLLDGIELQDLEKLSYKNPKSLISEAFRVIRTSILYSSADNNPRSLMVTSSQPIEGKTTCASNLAISLTQSGHRVVLLDADLRRPRLHKIFLSNGNAFGLSTYLVGKIELPGVIHHTDVNSLDIIPTGQLPPNPAELLGSKKMKELIERLNEEYDYVIIDSAPIAGFADSRLVARFVDGILLVTSVGVTQRQALQSSIENKVTVGGKIVGAILNRLELRGRKYGYSYYYYYGGDEKHKQKKLSGFRSPRS
ncbi:MAG: polysaccharide biosynthesis tyrosine autokinase, partial [Deltaproteobacteria bacterium]|nr:polysaccharide biosynthesis tyrosine autokinase [Deltaproteobacteria bacterium]